MEIKVTPPSDIGQWKAWSLLCIGMGERAGVTPISNTKVHVLLYLANTLAPLFGVAPVRGRILKRGPFPFYPDIQHHIDGLAYSGVLHVARVDKASEGYLIAHYTLGSQGSRLTEQLRVADAELDRTARLFRELLSASFGAFLSTRTEISQIDANIGDKSLVPGDVVDFSEWKDANWNIAVARYLLKQLSALHPIAGRDGIALYCEYLSEALSDE